MTIKEQLAELLVENRGKFISGEELAKRLYCTRSAVWKAVAALRKDGFNISAVTNRGYCLDDCDKISEAEIRRLTAAERIVVLKTTNSTNAYLREMARLGAPHGTLVVSSEQTNGSGRLGRSFFSPADTGIYMSILLRPDFPVQEAVKITSAAAVAVCLAIEEVCGASPEIKWVNDIYISGKKVAGILTEASADIENGAFEYAVLGIGINVYPPENGFPKEIADIAGAVLENRADNARNRLAAAVYTHFMKLYKKLPESVYLEEYRKRLMWKNERIYVLSGANGEVRTPAVLLEADENCALRVRYADGSEGTVFSGEICIRACSGSEEK